jgi:DNA-binding GntR family transcriptional regulator
MASRRYGAGRWALTTYELLDYRRYLERAIAFFAAQDPVPATRDELQAKLDAVSAEQDSRGRLAGA